MKKNFLPCFLSFLVIAFLFLPVVGQASSPVYRDMPRIRDAAPQSRFAKAIEDLPLMPGLEIEDGQDVLFVFGSERIARTVLVGPVDVDNVYYFYAETLPQLGWSQINLRRYVRNGEVLNLEARSANAEGKARVTFEVEPQSSQN